MRERDPDQPVTVVNRFQVKGDIAEFEGEFRDHFQFLRRQEDFDFSVTVGLVDDPRVYVRLGYWRTLRGFLDVVRHDSFVEHVRRIGPKVVTEADQAVSVRRDLREAAAAGSSSVVLLNAEAYGDGAELERRFAELSARCDEADGFGGSELLRSAVRPFAYTGLLWWRDAGDCDRAEATDGYRAALDAHREVAWVTTERSRHVSFERAIC
ncbi:hypothetical protein KQY30_18425 [Streptomyces sp. GMY02]|uniref:hypothetical protein n=1 Tax=Streptomyces sp. GMY02 TaxID=1333528 RepID=UPI001C2BA094|nr:hypothetical protein [Streptomyces sp. GMY02]QXE35944.1 hypothetical protein KQY30_18425 [Streptomyces sp. GMY02]